MKNKKEFSISQNQKCLICPICVNVWHIKSKFKCLKIVLKVDIGMNYRFSKYCFCHTLVQIFVADIILCAYVNQIF